jgi:hypothetical protein
MARTITYLTELAVGVVCLGAGTGLIRRGPRMAGLLLGVAGVAAVVHAMVRLPG